MVKKKKKDFLEKTEALLKKKLKSKKILKPSQMTMTIKKQEPYSVLGEPNRFFKHELEEVKGSMFSD